MLGSPPILSSLGKAILNNFSSKSLARFIIERFSRKSALRYLQQITSIEDLPYFLVSPFSEISSVALNQLELINRCSR